MYRNYNVHCQNNSFLGESCGFHGGTLQPIKQEWEGVLLGVHWHSKGALHATSCYEFIALMMETVSTPETSVNFYQTTRCNIPEDSHLMSSLPYGNTYEDALYSQFPDISDQQSGFIQCAKRAAAKAPLIFGTPPRDRRYHVLKLSQTIFEISRTCLRTF
jgi:hypothetical protein